MFAKHKALTVTIVAVLFIISTLFYGYEIERKRLNTHISSNDFSSLPNAWINTKIGFFSDTSIGPMFSLDNFDTAMTKLQQLQPDLIMFGGNLLSLDNTSLLADSQITVTLSNLRAPLGKFALLSYDDVIAANNTRVIAILTAANFTILTNANQNIYNKTLDPLNLISINHLASTDNKTKLLGTGKDVPSILLTNMPSLFTTISNNNGIKLTLASSTYGGIIGLPFVNQLFVHDKARPFTSGYSSISNQSMLVSAGLGTPPRIPLRVFNPPTVYLITLQTTKS
ncbi:MAG: metallophosphoesterase [Culicoidibacterales bacterium]